MPIDYHFGHRRLRTEAEEEEIAEKMKEERTEGWQKETPEKSQGVEEGMKWEIAQRDGFLHVESSWDIKDNISFISGHVDLIVELSKWYAVQKWCLRAGEIMMGWGESGEIG